jgi:hypothetical protein
MFTEKVHAIVWNKVRKVYKMFLNTRVTQVTDFESMQSRIESLIEIHTDKMVTLYAE